MPTKRIFTKEEIDDIIFRYQNNETTISIYELYKCSYAAIKRILVENDVFGKRNPIIKPDKKRCCTCRIKKDYSEFGKNKKAKDGYRHKCKECRKQFYNKNKEKIAKEGKIYRDNNKEVIKKRKKKYRDNNKTKIAKHHKQYREANKEKLKAHNKQYRTDNKEQIKKRRQTEEFKANRNKRRNERRKTDTNYRITDILRSRMFIALKGKSKSKHTLELLGCDIDFLLIYLQYTAWANDHLDFDINYYDTKEYHIDHIKPCSSFDLTDPEEQAKCFHYSNLQILTAKENLEKHNK